MNKLILITIALAASACTPATMKRGLHYAALGTEIAAQGSLVCDAGSTHSALAYGHGITETNTIMGDHPSDGDVGVYFATSAALVAGYNRVLPDVLRVIANVTVAGAEISAVYSNAAWHGGACGL